MQSNRLFCMGWIKIKMNITLNSFNRWSFLQKSLNMVKTPKLKFLDTSTCELFQLGSGRDGRERELLTLYHQPLSSHPLLDRVRKSARREVSRHLRLCNVCPLYPLFGDISKCEQAGGMRVSHDCAGRVMHVCSDDTSSLSSSSASLRLAPAFIELCSYGNSASSLLVVSCRNVFLYRLVPQHLSPCDAVNNVFKCGFRQSCVCDLRQL